MALFDMRDRLIVGLDLPTIEAADDMVDTLGDTVTFYKVGLQLTFAGGIDFARRLLDRGKKVFLDVKLLDIDNTVEKGVAAIAETGATMLTVHAYPKTMRAAQKAASGSGLCVLGVTVLTSMDDQDVKDAGYERDAAGLVALRAQQAREAGIGGIVASPHEAEMVRTIIGPKMALVTPGIRPAGSARGDQKRVMGPAEALAAGASHLVVARPIIEAADPAAAARAILAEMDGKRVSLA